MELIPGYGRKYISQREVLIDWNRGIPFKVNSPHGKLEGKYVSIHDLPLVPASETIYIRYKANSAVTVKDVIR